MSKAEERSKKLIIPKQVDDIEELCRFYYIKGYHQAEKDLELTWEDIEKITDIWDNLHEDETVYGKTGCDTPEFYQEVLKQFKDYKNEEV